MNRLWLRQTLAVVRLDVFKNLFALRAAPLYLLAALPVLVVLLILVVTLVLADGPEELRTVGGTTLFYAVLYQFILRFVVYTGCVFVFMNLFRGEVLDRSLHYYFLSPVRRELLVVSKFVSGWVTASLLFVGTTVVSMLLLYSAAGPTSAIRHVLSGPGFGQLLGYVGVTILACLGYGALFLAIGLFLRNLVVPALLIFLWELANPFLPAILKKLSVIFYLKSLLPVRTDEGPFAILADPASPWLAVPGLFVFAALALAAASLRIRRMEISYASD